jgi:ribonuclease-3
LARQLSHDFSDAALLELALTHRSAGGQHNERLEYLGDAVLGFVIADLLYQRFSAADEGQLSRLRAALVRRETLAEVAQDLRLGDFLQMGAGELGAGGQNRTSTLADALEAVLGAVFLDAGVDAARDLIQRLFAARIERLDPDVVLKDAKTRLQEWLQSQGRSLPGYEIIEQSGPQHQQTFRVGCLLEADGGQTEGIGSSRRRAEQAAAEAMLERLHIG